MKRTVIFLLFIFLLIGVKNGFPGVYDEDELADYSEPGGQVEVVVGEEFALSLKSNQTTGYKWVFAKPLDTEILEYKGTEYIPEETDRLGAGGTELWTFKAISSGTAMIALKYVRPWEKDKYPLKSFTYIVIVEE